MSRTTLMTARFSAAARACAMLPFAILVITAPFASHAEETPAPAPPAPASATPEAAATDDKAVRTLLDAIDRFTANEADLAEAIKTLQGRIEEVKAKNHEVLPRLEAATTAVADKARREEEIRTRLAELEKEIAALRGEAEGVEKELGPLRAALEAARAEEAAVREDLQLKQRLMTFLRALHPAPETIETAAAPPPAKEPEMKKETPKPAPAAAPPEPAAAAAAPAAPSAEGIEFFEKNIRPVLVETCYSCHGEEKQKSGLRLDSLAAMLAGGAQGASIVPGKPDESLLIKALRYEGDVNMPPDNMLSDEVIAAFAKWVEMGAPWPASPAPADAAAAEPTIEEKAAAHWAFQPVRKPAPPASDSEWVQSPVDLFILASLRDAGLSPNPVADKRTLIRRATYDLTGLAPTVAEIAAFQADDSPGAFARLTDRLLDSPRYGERWGRHWLDVARYADSKGYVFQEERRYAFSHTYRDYVIDAFNSDKPYDRFVTEQLAADRLDLGEDKRPLAAMGFLTLGRRFLNNPHDIIDDRLDVVARGLMGVTISCARCHDHKFDPIPTADYYSLYGVFASSHEPEPPLIAEPDADDPKYQEFKAVLDERQARADDYFNSKHLEFMVRYRTTAADYMLAAHDVKATEGDDAFQALAKERSLHHRMLRRWVDHLAKPETANDPVFGTWLRFSAIPAEEFEAKSAEVAAAAAANATEPKLNAVIAESFGGDAPKSMAEVAERYRARFAEADRLWGERLGAWTQITSVGGQEGFPKPSALEDAAREQIRQALYSPASPVNVPTGLVHDLMDLGEQAELRNRRLAVDRHKATHPGRPARAHILADNATPVEPVIFIRGSAGRRGDPVPRQFLSMLEGEDRKPFADGSGRLELARAITDPANPLTARVFVNRVWMHHFGSPLVGTPSDFGLRADAPTHPELLDYLAARFVEEGWSVKNLHRMIMLSSVYQQTADSRDDADAVDPENRLLWRFNRQRLDFEQLRDSLLQIAGTLDTTMGGDAVNIVDAPWSTRRTVYGEVERQNLPSLFKTFDFASPDSSSPGRYETTVPQQALYLMNHPFAIEQARKFAARATEAGETPDRVAEMIRLAWGREPAPTELEIGRDFISAQNEAPAEVVRSAWRYGYGAYDEGAKNLTAWTELPHFDGNTWGGGEKIPDPALGWVTLTRTGGHPGRDLDHSAVRRWIAPRDGVIEIRGKVHHPSENGDGVSAHVVSSRAGELGAWIAQHGEVRSDIDGVEVARGDTIDFIIHCRANESFDSFTWTPKIRMTEERESAAKIADGQVEWNAATEFEGPPPPPLGPWEQFAQVLLLSNEFAFVD